MGFMSGKRALIFGVASNRSIAWGIAKAMHREGADLAFTYMGERLRERVEKLAGECDSDIVLPCDVENDEQIEAVFEQLELKQQIFEELDQICASHTLLASNTSALSVTEMSAALPAAGRLSGLHFFNPVERMRLGEVVAPSSASAAARR